MPKPFERSFIGSRAARKKRPTVCKNSSKLRAGCQHDPGLINRAFALTETVAKSDNSKVMAHALYDSLSKPLCVWNNEAERVMRLLAIAMHLDGKNLGQYTAAVIQTFEPNVMWERAFLEARKTSYEAVHSPLAAKAAHDLDEFIDNEALTTDVPV